MKKLWDKFVYFMAWLALIWTVISSCVLAVVIIRHSIYRAMIYRPSSPEPSGSFPVQPEWAFTAQEAVNCTPVVEDSLVFINTEHKLYAISVEEGVEVWQLEHPTSTRCPYASAEVLVLPNQKGAIDAYDTKTGRPMWHDTFEKERAIYEDAVIFWENKVFVSRTFSFLTCYDLQSGSVLWEQETLGHTSVPLAAGDGVLYMGMRNSVYAYDAHQGQPLWVEDFGETVHELQLQASQLYVNSITALVAYDVVQRQIVWKTPLPERANTQNDLLLAEDKLYLSTDRILALSRSHGSILWESEVSPHNLGPMVILGESLFARDNENALYRVERTNDHGIIGKLLVKPVAESPVAAGDLLIVPFGDGRVFAYQP
ncbi:MAG: PQQ-binding-like beta-propeller repeat protein [Chloroflexota bacterium]